MVPVANEEEDLLASLDGGIFSITINRPKYRNAIAPALTPRIRDLIAEARANEKVRCLVFRGVGAHFSGGGDIASFKQSLNATPEARQADFRGRVENISNVVLELAAFDRPVIASLRGGVAGAALAFPLSADLVLADPTTTFAFAHQRLGLVPDGGLSYLLPRAVGERKARQLILTASAVNAELALGLGLIDEVLPPEQLEEATSKAAHSFTRAPQRSLRTAKRMLTSSLSNTFEQQLALEKSSIQECVCDPDFDEGVRAFIEKRAADFPSAR